MRGSAGTRARMAKICTVWVVYMLVSAHHVCAIAAGGLGCWEFSVSGLNLIKIFHVRHREHRIVERESQPPQRYAPITMVATTHPASRS